MAPRAPGTPESSGPELVARGRTFTVRALILSAGRGSRLGHELPKALIELGGRSLLDWQISALNGRATEVGVVVGYKASLFRRYARDHELFLDDGYEDTGIVGSLMKAAAWMAGEQDLLICYGDILYGHIVIDRLLGAERTNITMPANVDYRALWSARFADPLSDLETLKVNDHGRITEIGRKPRSYGEIQGQFMGILLVPAPLQTHILDEWRLITGSPHLSTTEFLDHLINRGWAIVAVPTPGEWLEIDTADDYHLYERWLRRRSTPELESLLTLARTGGVSG
ncbi:phosphocholine cytidylyltransferase family protein [Modestobacter sp. URMC 112]